MVGKDAINHARLRLGLSALQHHRFKYNLIDDKSCLLCLHPKEDANHFIFHCPAYATLRVSLLEGLSDLLPIHIYGNKSVLENILLFGNSDIDYDVMMSVFSMFQNYIHETGRFR